MIKYKNFLIGLLVVAFIFHVSKFYSFYIDYSEWQYADWLINYQAGFIRRGFIGEFLFRIYQVSGIGLDKVIFIFVVTILSFISYFLIKSVKFIQNSYTNILIFLSPGFFLYPIMNSGIIGRKDILLIFAVGFFVFFEKKFNSIFLFFLFILSIFVLSLSHSGQLFFIPYLVFLYVLIKSRRLEKISILEIVTILLTLILIFFLILNYQQASDYQVSEICSSVKSFINKNCENIAPLYFLTLSKTDHSSVFNLNQYYLNKHFLINFIFLILVNFFFGIKLYYLKFRVKNFKLKKTNPLLIFILLFLCTLPIYFIAIDWGRWIYMSYSCSVFLFIYCLKENLFLNNYEIRFKKFLFFIILVTYSFLWTIPFYNAESFKFTLKKPFLSILKNF